MTPAHPQIADGTPFSLTSDDSQARVGRLTYIVRRSSLSGEQLGTYRHPGPEEPKVGTLLSPLGGLDGGPWRVSDFVQTDDSAPANNVLVVEQIDA